MLKGRDHKVEVWTTSGAHVTGWVTEEDSSYYDNLPFNSSNVTATRVTTPHRMDEHDND
jgi:hypothetical protein